MAEAVKNGRRDTVRDREGEFGDEPVERLARAARVHAAPAVKSEQRGAGASGAALGQTCEELTDARPAGDQAGLAVMPTSA